MFFPVPILIVVSRFDCRKVELNKQGARAPRTAYDLPKPPPAPGPSAAPKVESQSTTHESQDALNNKPPTPPRHTKHPKLASAAKAPTPKPGWKSLTFDIEAWDDTLADLNVDQTAQQELYCLAQFSGNGAKAANHVISKVLNKIADGDQVRNWSAFVHSCVKSARHDLEWNELE